MTTYVLVGGFWIGAWAWRDVVDRLTAAGHRAIAPDLTGLGEKRHLGGPEVRLETHIGDVVGAIEADDLTGVVLVGHSAGGAIVNAVADRIPERIAGIVFIDTGPLPDGVAIVDFQGPTARADTEARAVDGWRLPFAWEAFPEPMFAGLDDAARTLMRDNVADEPLGVMVDPVRLTGRLRADLPCWAILDTMPLPVVREMIASGNPLFAPMGGPSWTLMALPTGHWPMLSEPDKLAAMIAAWPDAAAATSRGAS